MDIKLIFINKIKMAQLINEIKRMQFLAGIITEGELGVNVISNTIPKPAGHYWKEREKQKAAQAAASNSAGRPDGAFKIQLKIDGKSVMATTADGNPSPEELSDVLAALELKHGNRFDFEKAEMIVLDPSGKQVGSITKQDNFLKTKTKHVGDTYSTTHGTV